eukprot:3044104-Amphidinium_carterae.1
MSFVWTVLQRVVRQGGALFWPKAFKNASRAEFCSTQLADNSKVRCSTNRHETSNSAKLCKKNSNNRDPHNPQVSFTLYETVPADMTTQKLQYSCDGNDYTCQKMQL